MKMKIEIVFGALLFAFSTLAPIATYASKTPEHHDRSLTYHDHTPKVPSHGGSHPHR